MSVTCLELGNRYNNLRRNTQRVEFKLIESQVKQIDEQLAKAVDELCWTSEGEPASLAGGGRFLWLLVRRPPIDMPANLNPVLCSMAHY